MGGLIEYKLSVKGVLKNSGEEVKIISYDTQNDQFEIQYDDGSYKVVNGDELVNFWYPEDNAKRSSTYFEKKGTEIGKLVDEKQRAYGDSVTKSFELMKIFLRDYRNEDNTYTIPESLLQHLLLQVRIIDKQNRIFNNPDGDLMSENPYGDTVGYGLIGVRMCDGNNQ